MIIKLLKNVYSDMKRSGAQFAAGSYLDHVEVLYTMTINEKEAKVVEFQYGLMIHTFILEDHEYEIINNRDLPIP